MGLETMEYLRRFDRVNLCEGKWSSRVAREKADQILADVSGRGGGVVVLLGKKVATAFGIYFRPFSTWSSTLIFPHRTRVIVFVILPHPSGRCREWNAPGSAAKAKDVLRAAGVLGPQEVITDTEGSGS